MTQEKKPIITRELLEYLTRHFPEKAPDPRDTNREVWMKAGNVEIVNHLKHLHKEQARNVLQG